MPVIKEKKSLCVAENFDYVTFITQNGKQGKILIANNELELSYKKIICVDLTHCSSLKKLDIGFNLLSQIDISNCKNLEELNVAWNKLTNLDASKNPNLKKITVENNKLTQIDVSNCKNLEELYVQNNQLTNLDISKNLKLKELITRSNKFKKEWTSKNKKDLLEIATKIIKSNKHKDFEDCIKSFNKAFLQLCNKDKTYYGWDVSDLFPRVLDWRMKERFMDYLVTNVKGISEEYLKFIQMPNND